MKVAVLIPALDECLTISKVIADFQRYLPEADIYVIDNNSSDCTVEEALGAGAKLIQVQEKGKGNAVRVALKKIQADIYVLVDADNTYDASSVKRLMAPVQNNQVDLAIATRRPTSIYSFPFCHKIGNRIISSIFNFCFRTGDIDVLSGYRAFNKNIATLPMQSTDFTIETEMTALTLLHKHRIRTISTRYRPRPKGSHAKLNTIKDGFKIIRKIFNLYKNFRPLEFYWVVSGMFLSFILALT